MSNSLRDEIKAIEYWQGVDGDPDYPEDVYGPIPDEVIDQILKLIASKMPEKEIFHPNQVLITEKEWYKAGRNSYRTEFKSILKGETE